MSATRILPYPPYSVEIHFCAMLWDKKFSPTGAIWTSTIKGPIQTIPYIRRQTVIISSDEYRASVIKVFIFINCQIMGMSCSEC
jgi:hypothetical protein